MVGILDLVVLVALVVLLEIRVIGEAQQIHFTLIVTKRARQALQIQEILVLLGFPEVQG
jgi:hypothetical protein